MATTNGSKRANNFKDLTGQVFGRLTVIRYHSTDSDRRATWLCQCECGRDKTVKGRALLSGNARSCGCGITIATIQRNKTRVRKPFIHDLTGQVFGRLTVLRFHGKSRHGKTLWWCRCECGTEKEIRAIVLKNGETRSCGCLQVELTSQRFTTHRQCKTSEYCVWAGMIQRCSNPNSTSFPRYGGRGITVCKRWHSFEAFLKDMGPRPSQRHSIDRKDNSKGYCKANCRWVTAKEQNRNKRTNRMLAFNGKMQSVAEWADELDIDPGVIHLRLRYGWSVDHALSTPVGAIRSRRWELL